MGPVSQAAPRSQFRRHRYRLVQPPDAAAHKYQACNLLARTVREPEHQANLKAKVEGQGEVAKQ